MFVWVSEMFLCEEGHLQSVAFQADFYTQELHRAAALFCLSCL